MTKYTFIYYLVRSTTGKQIKFPAIAVAVGRRAMSLSRFKELKWHEREMANG